MMESTLFSAGFLAATLLLAAPARAETCTTEQIQTAVNAAGERLRLAMQASQPQLDTRLLKLKDALGWSDSDYREKGYNLLEDERTARLDAQASELFGRLDQLGAEASVVPDCQRLRDIDATSLELQVTVKAKSQYLLSKLDQMAVEKKPVTAAASAPPVTAPVTTPGTAPGVAATKAATPPAMPKTQPAPQWSTQTKPQPELAPAQPPAPAVVAVAPPPASPAAEVEEFSIDEIVAAAQGPFGKTTANLARVLEHTFAKQGKPSGYILGDESGGAFIAGLRYGKGTIYLRNGQSMPVYWHGPSLGADIGAQGAAVLFLVYRVREPIDVISTFTGLEGSAFVVGGVGVTFMSNKRIDMAPIRSGLGLRVGANVGYMRFTTKPTWNPF